MVRKKRAELGLPRGDGWAFNGCWNERVRSVLGRLLFNRCCRTFNNDPSQDLMHHRAAVRYKLDRVEQLSACHTATERDCFRP